MDVRLVASLIVIVVLIGVAAYGFFLYSSESSRYSNLLNSYSSLSGRYSLLSTQYSSLNSSYSSLSSTYSSLSSNYSSLSTLYNALKQNFTMMYNQFKQNYSQLLTTTSSIKVNGSAAAVLQFLDGLAIESTSSVTPFLAPNFTATIKGVPFPGYYTYSNFTSWLNAFFNTYETVYFYTTALPTMTQQGNEYRFSAVVQYFVAPSKDPVELQVFNASLTADVILLSGNFKIIDLSWVGNLLPPSAVIAGYPSQHKVAANQALEALLGEVNGMGAEFPANQIASAFSSNATLSLQGTLPLGLKAGNYTGLSQIEGLFNQWDTLFVFAVTYAQNLLPNGTAVPPSVSVTLSPNSTWAVVVANDTPFITFVAAGQPGYPAIYDIHMSFWAYLTYNSTSASWQIQREIVSSKTVPVTEDAPGYPITPLFKVAGEQTVTITRGEPAVLQVGNIITIVQPGTMAETPTANLTTFNFTLVLFSVQGVFSPPSTNLVPLYAYAFEVNGQITPAISLVNNVTGKPEAPISVVAAPNTWTSWTWLGGTFNGSAYVGGKYVFPNPWIYGNGVMVNTVFFKPVIWIFEESPQPIVAPAPQVQVQVSQVPGLDLIASYTVQVNSSKGAVVQLGPLLVAIKPGTTAFDTSTKTSYTVYNFSLLIYSPLTVSSPSPGQVPYFVFAYAINGQVTPNILVTQPFITIIYSPTQGANMWTWIGGKYVFHPPIVLGNNVVVNLIFTRPVPWVLTLPSSLTTSTGTTTSTSTSSTTTTSTTTSTSTSSTTTTSTTSTTSSATYYWG